MAQEDFTAEAEHPEQGKIVGMGVRCFPKGENPKDGSSLAAPRRECRLARRRCRRRARRMWAIRQIFLRQNLVTEAELTEIYAKQTGGDVWDLRVKGLTSKLEPVELVRVLTHLAKHRGFKSYRKAEEVKDKEAGKVLQAIKANKVKADGYQTLAQSIVVEAGATGKKRNSPDKYTNSIPREAIEDETRKLFEAQQTYGIFTQKLYDDFCRVAFRYRPVGNITAMVGNCIFEPKEKRAPKMAPSAELFVALGRINNTKIKDLTQERELTTPEREAILQLLYEMKELKYSTIHRKVFADAKTLRFKALNYTKTSKIKKDGTLVAINPEDEVFCSLQGYHALEQAISKNVSVETWQQLRQDMPLLDKIAVVLTCYKNDEDIGRELQKLGLGEEVIAVLLQLSFAKFINLSLKALYKIVPHMREGDIYDKACLKAGYDFKNTGESLVDKKGKLLAVIANDKLTTVPTVNRTIAQFRKVYNAMVRRYGEPDQINLEMARELKHNYDERRKIEQSQKDNQNNTLEVKKFLQENGIPVNGSNILKYKLYQQQNGQCIYSGKPLDLLSCFRQDHYVEVDHIIPYSRSLDNGFNNKVLCLTAENQRKGNHTPHEYLGKDAETWQQFMVRINSTESLGRRKINNLLTENYAEREQDFRESNAHDNSYIANYIKKYLDDGIDFGSSHYPIKNRVQSRNGALTDYLRHQWGLIKDRAADDKHHAQDAVVIACATQGMVQYLSTISSHLEQKEQLINEKGQAWYKSLKHKFDEPWSGFRTELHQGLENIFVSRSSHKNATGEAHKDTISSISEGKGSWPVRGGIAEKANMFRYDVFTKEDKYYIVPIYVVDTINKNRQDIYYPLELDEQHQPKTIDDSYDFQFTLYKDSYVKLVTKDAKEFTGYVNKYGARTGQIYLETQDNSFSYVLSTSSFELDELLLLPSSKNNNVICRISEYNPEEAKLIAVEVQDPEKVHYLEAKPKSSKSAKGSKKFQTTITYQKLSNIREFCLSTLQEIEKFEVDMLGGLVRIRHEMRLPVNNRAKSK